MNTRIPPGLFVSRGDYIFLRRPHDDLKQLNLNAISAGDKLAPRSRQYILDTSRAEYAPARFSAVLEPKGGETRSR